MEDTVPNPCISCGKEVRIRQQGLQCDDCMRWQHRTCGTGITQSEYRTAARNNGVIDWTCNDCTTGREASVDIAHFSVTMSQTLSTTTSSNPNQTYNATQNSFNIEQSFQTPSDPEEESMLSNIHNATAESDQNDTTESDSMEVDVEIEYKIIENGTKRGKPKLVSSDGFSYTLKRQTTRATHWFCSHRPKSGKCPATIAQIGEAFNEGPHQHNHAPDNISHIEITARMRELAQRNSNIFTPAASMAEDLMKEEYRKDPSVDIPKPSNLARQANRSRQKRRPKEPRNNDFELKTDFLPQDFLKADIKFDNQRHIILATDTQLEILSNCRNWYMDGTFSIVRQPFHQLMTIHAFIKKGENAKQVPLVYVLMTRRKAKDYKEVFRSLNRLLPREIALQTITLDFEKAAWKTIREIYPSAQIRGCFFHWVQAVFRKVTEKGLKREYSQREELYLQMKRLFALPLIPAEHIPQAFERMKAQSHQRLNRLFTYVERTWISNNTFPVESWCVFGRSTRTNNDTEGWHRRIQYKNKQNNIPMYVLIPLLFEETVITDINCKLMSERKLCKHQRRNYTATQFKLFALWRSYEEGELSTSRLLKKCSKIYAPE